MACIKKKSEDTGGVQVVVSISLLDINILFFHITFGTYHSLNSI